MTEPQRRVAARWQDISDAVDYDRVFFRDNDPAPWRRSTRGTRLIRPAKGELVESIRGEEVIRYDEMIYLMVPDILEPEDGTRLEFVHNTDVYGMWRDDDSSDEAGWTSGPGGQTWTLYPGSVPWSWDHMLVMFGDSLVGATVLQPITHLEVG